MLLSHSWWQNSEELGLEGIGRHGSDVGVEWVLASASAALCSARIASCSSMYWLGGVLTVYSKGVGTRSPMRLARGRSRSSMSISSLVIGDVIGTGGGAKKCSDSIRGGIGIGDGDVDERLAEFMIGDCGSEMDLVPTHGAGGVNKGWVGLVVSSKGGVVGEDIPTLVDSGDNGVVIFLLSIVCNKWGKDIRGDKRHVAMSWSLFCVLFILLVPPNSAKSSGACKSSALTHESCAGEYPFHLTRYCFFFHRPYVRALIICSTSHSSSPSTISGGGSIKLGLC